MTNFYTPYGNNNNMFGAYFNPQQQMQNMINQHPQYFNQSMQQGIATNQQQIATQPPIMQSVQSENRNSAKMLYVGNKEEATAHPVDLIYNTPTFFYNRGTNEVYMKQYDGNTGNAKFKIYTEVNPQHIEQTQPQIQNATIAIPNDNAYMNELKMIRAGIDGLYRYLNLDNQAQTQPKQYYREEEIGLDEEEEIIDVDFVSSVRSQKPQVKSTNNNSKGKSNGK